MVRATHMKTSERKRGFAAMDPDKQRAIASKGGKAAHDHGKGHVWTSEEARAAGRKGGKAVSADRAHMAALGRLGGQRRHHPAKASTAAAVEDQDP